MLKFAGFSSSDVSLQGKVLPDTEEAAEEGMESPP